jgi:hypothetical protein
VGNLSAAGVQSASSTTDWHLETDHEEAPTLSVADPNIDDPVNDTGLGPRRGDLQLSDEFACLVRLICDESGGFS